MKLKGGLQLHQDDQANKYEKVDLSDANRIKSKTEKQIDDMLFGSRPPPRRSNQNKSVTQTPKKDPEQNKEESSKKPSPLPPKTPVKSEAQSRPPIRNIDKTDRSRFSRTSQKTEQNLLESTQKPKQPQFNSTPKPKATTERNIRAKTEISSMKKKQPQPSPPVQEYLPGQVFNRPAYIRKLKKVARNFQYQHLHSANHKHVDVIRQVDCHLQTALRYETDNFKDIDFPHTALSISYKNRKQNFEWKQAKNIFKKVGFGRYIDPNDLSPGKYSSSAFLSTLACLAQYQENIKRLIQNQSHKENGFYYVRLNVNSAWKYFTVDEYLPELNGQAIGVRSYPDSESDLWASLIQKAYAKAFGSYQIFNCQKNSTQEYLNDLTGAVVKKYESSSQELKQIIQKAQKSKFVIIGVPNQNISTIGLNKSYNICIKGLNSRKNIELRNSWGTIVDKPSIKYSNDGIFQLTFEDFKTYFNYVLIAETDDKICTSTIQSKHEKSFYSCYTFDVVKNGNWSIKACQSDHKLFPDTVKYSYSPFHLVLEKREKSGERKYVAGGFSRDVRNLIIQASLEQGNYGVYCIGSWNQKAYNYNVTVYGSQTVNISRVYINEHPNEIVKSLETLNIAAQNKKSKGNLTEFTLHDKSTNLIILTVQNSSDKNQNCNQDFSRIKPDLVQLITKSCPEQNLTRLESMKKKSVNISLKGNQAYTWVFSVNKKDIQNLREIGLN